ncbi:MAG TPA: hypothetical protein VGQ63_13840 [Pseudolabrys sp.]|jgi:hypothetical protein|nr:hypothetical protein [Pseudolabrys sp.]
MVIGDDDKIVYGRTPEGQLVYDLAFTNLPAKYLARKHRTPVERIRFLRASSEIKKLRRQNRMREKVK